MPNMQADRVIPFLLESESSTGPKHHRKPGMTRSKFGLGSAITNVLDTAINNDSFGSNCAPDESDIERSTTAPASPSRLVGTYQAVNPKMHLGGQPIGCERRVSINPPLHVLNVDPCFTHVWKQRNSQSDHGEAESKRRSKSPSKSTDSNCDPKNKGTKSCSPHRLHEPNTPMPRTPVDSPLRPDSAGINKTRSSGILGILTAKSGVGLRPTSAPTLWHQDQNKNEGRPSTPKAATSNTHPQYHPNQNRGGTPIKGRKSTCEGAPNTAASHQPAGERRPISEPTPWHQDHSQNASPEGRPSTPKAATSNAHLQHHLSQNRSGTPIKGRKSTCEGAPNSARCPQPTHKCSDPDLLQSPGDTASGNGVALVRTKRSVGKRRSRSLENPHADSELKPKKLANDPGNLHADLKQTRSNKLDAHADSKQKRPANEPENPPADTGLKPKKLDRNLSANSLSLADAEISRLKALADKEMAKLRKARGSRNSCRPRKCDPATAILEAANMARDQEDAAADGTEAKAAGDDADDKVPDAAEAPGKAGAKPGARKLSLERCLSADTEGSGDEGEGASSDEAVHGADAGDAGKPPDPTGEARREPGDLQTKGATLSPASSPRRKGGRQPPSPSRAPQEFRRLSGAPQRGVSPHREPESDCGFVTLFREGERLQKPDSIMLQMGLQFDLLEPEPETPARPQPGSPMSCLPGCGALSGAEAHQRIALERELRRQEEIQAEFEWREQRRANARSNQVSKEKMQVQGMRAAMWLTLSQLLVCRALV